jgi:putative hydroxymethylpyrimidine transporter CytX
MSNQNAKMTKWNFTTLWFGAAVSVAEIMTGALVAPLGFTKGLTAILVGHLLGTLLLILGGVIGSQQRLSAMESTKISFGSYGSYLFSILNVLQLLGWTAIMILTGARSINLVTIRDYQFDHLWVWCLVIGVLIAIWLYFGQNASKKLNSLAVCLLFVLTIVLCFVIFKSDKILTQPSTAGLSFGEAVELSVIMPLSWIPLISDYTRFAKTTKDGAIGSFIGYMFGSSWMYIIGLGAALAFNEVDPVAVLMSANLGLFAVGIVVLATVTTTFMDAYSAGISVTTIFPKLNGKHIALIVTASGTLLAVIFPIEKYEGFLYTIGSFFAPLYAILLTDYFILKRTSISKSLKIDWIAFITWILGVFIYRKFVQLDFFLGATVPSMILICVIYIVVQFVINKLVPKQIGGEKNVNYE